MTVFTHLLAVVSLLGWSRVQCLERQKRVFSYFNSSSYTGTVAERSPRSPNAKRSRSADHLAELRKAHLSAALELLEGESQLAEGLWKRGGPISRPRPPWRGIVTARPSDDSTARDCRSVEI